MKILVVDDNVDAADSLAMLLQLSQHEVKTAHDGEQALTVARDFRPDVAFLDLGLPKIDGYALARLLRDDPATSSARLIALSGFGSPEHVEKSRAAGFTEHLTKPIDFARLDEVVSH